MPRQARLDAPGLLQHVMARGIERREIFKDDKDRQSFLARLAVILEESQTQCYAWALIPNHFHLLLRTGTTPLSKVMRRLMTGYAVTFNKRHKRSGHLFQNRYKSTVCEEDEYLLELIRYIHLNPLRAGLVKDLKELDKYPWSGHSALMGKRKNFLALGVYGKPDKMNKSLAEMTIEDVLLNFGENMGLARRRYRQFVKDGIAMGRRPEFQGGGLVRSAGGNPTGLLGRKAEERELSDARILGSGDFVAEALQKAGKPEEIKTRSKISLDELIDKVIKNVGIEHNELTSSRRGQKIRYARAVISYLAVNQLGCSASYVARKLGMSGMGVGKCVQRGNEILDKPGIMQEYLA